MDVVPSSPKSQHFFEEFIMAEGTVNLNETPDPDNTFSCVACKRPDSADTDMVACDKCNSWWHYTCAGVTDSISVQHWVCSKCLPIPPKILSVRTTSSTRKARLELALKRLEEQRELNEKQLELDLDKSYMQEKYQLLEESLLEEEANRSVHSQKSEVDPQEHVKQVSA